MTRRRFLRIAALAGLTTTVAAYSGLFRRLSRWLDPRRSRVALVPCAGYGAELARQIATAWDLGGGPDPRGRTVLLKANLVDHTPGKPINTDARFLAALADMLMARGARAVTVGDGPGNRRDIDEVLGVTGLADELARRKIPFVDLNTDDLVRVETKTLDLSEASRVPQLFLPRAVVGADLVVSVAKLKTHHWSGVTLSLKNLFGVIPGCRYGWPKNILHWNGIDRSILEIYGTVRPAFAMIDGIVGMEGDGPLNGDAKEVGLIAAGADMVSLDATAARVMGVSPEKILYLQAAEDLRLGRLDIGHIDLAGELLEKHQLRFLLPKGFEHMAS